MQRPQQRPKAIHKRPHMLPAVEMGRHEQGPRDEGSEVFAEIMGVRRPNQGVESGRRSFEQLPSEQLAGPRRLVEGRSQDGRAHPIARRPLRRRPQQAADALGQLLSIRNAREVGPRRHFRRSVPEKIRLNVLVRLQDTGRLAHRIDHVAQAHLVGRTALAQVLQILYLIGGKRAAVRRGVKNLMNAILKALEQEHVSVVLIGQHGLGSRAPVPGPRRAPPDGPGRRRKEGRCTPAFSARRPVRSAPSPDGRSSRAPRSAIRRNHEPTPRNCWPFAWPPKRRKAGRPAPAAIHSDTAAPGGGRAPRQRQHVAARQPHQMRPRQPHRPHGQMAFMRLQEALHFMEAVVDRLRRRFALGRPDEVGGEHAQVRRGGLRSGQHAAEFLGVDLTVLAGRRREAGGPGAVARTDLGPARPPLRCRTSATPPPRIQLPRSTRS